MTVTSLLSHAVEARPGFWSWQLDPFVLIGVAAAALLYGRAFRRVRRSRSVSAFPTRRGICFMAGLGVVAIALLSPVDAYAEFLLSVHMTQHVLLTMVAAPLLVLGAPITLALAATSAHGGRRIVLRVLRGRFVRVVGSPVFAWVAFFAVMWAWHLPALYDAALRNDGVHAVEHAAFLATALLFWWPVVAVDPNPTRISHPARLLYMFLAMPAMAILGLALTSANRILYPFYAVASPSIGVSPVSDQHLAGATMWEGGLLLMMPAMVLVLFDWMGREERAAERSDDRRRREAAVLAEPVGGEPR